MCGPRPQSCAMLAHFLTDVSTVVNHLALLGQLCLVGRQLVRGSQHARLGGVCGLLQCCPLRLCLPQGLPAAWQGSRTFTPRMSLVHQLFAAPDTCLNVMPVAALF